MSRRNGRVPLRIDIVGLNAARFQECLNAQLLESTARHGSASTTLRYVNEKDDAYYRIASIALDFRRAYGSAVTIRAFARSSNRFLERILLAFKGPTEDVPVIFVNGVRIYRGVPKSFSELDEAIEKAFRKT